MTSEATTPPVQTGEPVPGFPLKFTWRTDKWRDIFDEQIELLKADVARARADGRIVLYLSCPISSRGGGWSGTNVDIARHVERSILKRWGEGFWVLNPAQYQLESKAGTGLIVGHAKRLGIDLDELLASGYPSGGDYLRMWTKVLVEDGANNLGHNFDAFYFLGPTDVFSFFTENGSQSMTAGIQNYFARKMDCDIEFRKQFAVPEIDFGASARSGAQDHWTQLRFDFLRFYGLRASANFSLGSHDEWQILRLINEGRRKETTSPTMLDGDVGQQIAAFFDGNQVSMAATEISISRGYSL
ncbi:hypothetical protein [Microvirga lotononidis]|uniref:Uncharacterized protein n=1 Tax=Microvirga lotononidis TaxID=864069 RepID=I4Z4L9_9HYPH|nr:hypothetical protein [Microvirga lotononidis]EIM31161.1 hypothetical protein MicloDRAFT_00001510 [Microvirga lotononidis]WQO30447.1 hypothetical protein U0023_23615 [Microvirga lotononidis]